MGPTNHIDELKFGGKSKIRYLFSELISFKEKTVDEKVKKELFN
jgi:hypothetical protein